MNFNKLKNVMYRRYTNKKTTDEDKQSLEQWAVPMCALSIGQRPCNNRSVTIDDKFAIEVYDKLKINIKRYLLCETHLNQFKGELQKTEEAVKQNSK